MFCCFPPDLVAKHKRRRTILTILSAPSQRVPVVFFWFAVRYESTPRSLWCGVCDFHGGPKPRICQSFVSSSGRQRPAIQRCMCFSSTRPDLRVSFSFFFLPRSTRSGQVRDEADDAKTASGDGVEPFTGSQAFAPGFTPHRPFNFSNCFSKCWHPSNKRPPRLMKTRTNKKLKQIGG